MDFSFIFRCWRTPTEPQAPVTATQEDETQENETHEDETQESEMHEINFLSLPPEVRNMIYRYALVEERIHVTIGTTQPGLLPVNRQTRQEAILIYYKENSFYWDISAFNAASYIAWCVSSEHRLDVTCLWKLRGPRNWKNLLCWLEAYYKGECKGPGLRKRQPFKPWPKKTCKVVGAKRMFQLVRNMGVQQKLEWKDSQANLELVHRAYCELNPKWELEK